MMYAPWAYTKGSQTEAESVSVSESAIERRKRKGYNSWDPSAIASRTQKHRQSAHVCMLESVQGLGFWNMHRKKKQKMPQPQTQPQPEPEKKTNYNYKKMLLKAVEAK